MADEADLRAALQARADALAAALDSVHLSSSGGAAGAAAGGDGRASSDDVRVGSAMGSAAPSDSDDDECEGNGGASVRSDGTKGCAGAAACGASAVTGAPKDGHAAAAAAQAAARCGTGGGRASHSSGAGSDGCSASTGHGSGSAREMGGGGGGGGGGSSGSGSGSGSGSDDGESDVFDSDSDGAEGVGGGGAAAAAPAPVEDPLYDAGVDDEDAAWVESHMREGGGRSGLRLAPSAAVLSCPACFSTVCTDCTKLGKRRSERNHWRATAVCDCTVVAERLRPGAVTARQLPPVVVRSAGKTEYRQVQCGYCATEVAVFEVGARAYLFYNAIPTAQ